MSAAASAASARSVRLADDLLHLLAGARCVDQRAQLGDLLPVESGCPGGWSSSLRRRGRRRVEGEGDQHRALALDQVVAGRLAGHRRVAEDAEQVVAQLERLAERQPEPGQLRDLLAAARRPARRRCAAGRSMEYFADL